MASPVSYQNQPLPRRFVLAFRAALLASVLYAAEVTWRFGGDTVLLYLSDAGTVLAALLASVACYRAGRRHLERLRLFWWLLSAACLSWMLGEGVWTIYDLSGSGSPPVPSLADAGYLGFIPLAVAALLCHPGLRGSGVRKARILLDGLAIAAALLFLSWTAVLGPLWRSSDLTSVGDFITLAYPFGDVVIGFFVILALRRMESEDRLALWCLLAGLIFLALADSAFAYVVEVKGYTSGQLLDVGWFAGFLVIALGALAADVRELPVPADSPILVLPSLVAPLVPMLVALVVAGITIDVEAPPDRVALGLVLALIALALIRQALLILDFVTAGRGVQQGRVVDRIARAALTRVRSEDRANRPRGDPPPGRP